MKRLTNINSKLIHTYTNTAPNKIFVINGKIFLLVPVIGKYYLNYYEIDIEENEIRLISNLKDFDLTIYDPDKSFSFFVLSFVGPDVQNQNQICGIQQE